MAAMFAGASRALLASIVFAFECTQKPLGLLPLLGGCSAAFLASCLLMQNSIMTERIARRGARVVGDYSADHLAQVLVKDCMTLDPVTVLDTVTVAEVRAQLDAPSHRSQGGFPVLDDKGEIVGVVTRSDLLDEELDPTRTVRDVLQRRPIVIHEFNSAREAADQMVAEGVGRLPVIARDDGRRLVGMVTRADLMTAHQTRLHAARSAEPSQLIPKLIRERFGSKANINPPT
jgi:CBS domain-containing protein